MKVIFWMRAPNEQTPVAELDLDAVPREGESVALDPDAAVHTVHSVTWILAGPRVHVLLR